MVGRVGERRTGVGVAVEGGGGGATLAVGVERTSFLFPFHENIGNEDVAIVYQIVLRAGGGKKVSEQGKTVGGESVRFLAANNQQPPPRKMTARSA